ncbi:ABC transporter permease [Stomatohabitans albus]|uniref:ABC transporter permease n=1 Tax=Stomatohabitans albus TaxID=3110766 RepID=UPI00300D1C66
MRALFKISAREVREGFSRFFLTMLSVALGVAFLTGTLTLRDSLQSTFDDIIGLSSRADVFVVGTKISETLGSSVRRSMPVSYEHKIRRSLDDQAVVDPTMNTVDARLENAEGEIISNAGAPTIVQPYQADPLWGSLEEGRWPKGSREILVDKAALEPNGLHVGDRTTLILAGGSRQVTITGSIAFEQPSFGTVQIFMDRDAIESIAAPDGKVLGFEIYLPDDIPVADAIQRIAHELPADTIVMGKERYTADRYTALESGLGFISIFLLVFVFLSIFIGSFVIANTFAMVVRQRLKQFAMLRAIGASPTGIFVLVITQAIAIGLLGSLAGIVLGMTLMAGVGVLFSQIGLEINLVAMSLPTMLIGLGTGLVVTTIGAVLSARTAALTDPLDVLRNAQGANDANITWVNWVSALVLGIGILITVIGAQQTDLTMVGYGAAAVLFGTLGLLSVIANPIIRVVSKPFAVVLPVQTHMAVENIVRNAKRTASTSGALVIGVALVMAGATLSSSLKGGGTNLISNYTDIDLFVYDGQGRVVSRSDAGKIADIDGVQRQNWSYIGQVAIERDQETASDVATFVANDVKDFRNYTVLDGDDDALADNEIMINTLRTDRDAWAVGDEVTITTPFGSRTAKVGAIIESPVFFSSILLPDSWSAELLGSSADPVSIDIKIDDGADLETVKHDINQLFVEHATYEARTAKEVNGQDGAQIDLILAILYALLALSVVTAVFGIVNTLALSVMDRVREIGMIRAIGMSRSGVMTMITLESVLLTIFGVIIGMGIGLGLSWALVAALVQLGISKVIFPWGTIAALIIGAMIIGVLAAYIPALRAARVNELQAMTE